MSHDLDWAGRVQRLEAEVAGLRRAMSGRAPIEQAKGVLAERLGCSPDDAFAHLSRLSQQSNVRLADLAASIVSSMVPTPAKSLTQITGLTPADAERYQRMSALAAASTDLVGLASALQDAAERVAFVRFDGDSPAEVAASGSGPSGAAAAAEAIVAGHAVWQPSEGTQNRAAAFPIRLDERVAGAVTFTWSAPADFDRFRAPVPGRRGQSRPAHLPYACGPPRTPTPLPSCSTRRIRPACCWNPYATRVVRWWTS